MEHKIQEKLSEIETENTEKVLSKQTNYGCYFKLFVMFILICFAIFSVIKWVF